MECHCKKRKDGVSCKVWVPLKEGLGIRDWSCWVTLFQRQVGRSRD